MRNSAARLPRRRPQESSSPYPTELSLAVRIRPFASDDLDAVLKTQRACKAVAAWRAHDYQVLARDPGGMLLVAESDDATPPAVVGFSALYRVDAEAELWSLAVNPAHRRKGIARAMLREAWRRLLGAGVKKLFLEVRESNLPAVELYRSFGFQPLARRRDYYQNPAEDALVLACKLGEDEA